MSADPVDQAVTHDADLPPDAWGGPLHLVGTPHGAWKPVADALWDQIGRSTTVTQGGVDTAAWAHLGGLSEVTPDARFVVFVDSPARALSQWLTGAEGGGATAAQAEWRDGARQLLQLAYRWPARCLYVDAAEAQAAPAELARALGHWHAALVSMPALEMPALPAAPLGAALAQLAAAADTAAQRLHEELHTLCVPLVDDEAMAPPSEDPLAALDQYASWVVERTATNAELAKLGATSAQLQRQLQSLTQRDQGLQADRAQLAQQLAEAQAATLQTQQAAAASAAALQVELVETRQEAELLLAQLHQVQEELETVFLKGQETKKQWQQASAAAGEQARQIATANSRADAALGQRDAQAKLAQERAVALEAAQRQQRQLSDNLAGAQQASATLRQEQQALQQRREQAEAQSAALLQENHSLQQRQQQAESTAAALLQEKHALLNREQHADAQLATLLQDVEALQQRHRQAESQVDALMQEGQAAQQLLQQAEQRAASAARQVQQQAEQLAALQARLEQVQAQRDAQAQVADDRELQLELARADEARLKAELQGARDGADVLLAQVLAAQSAADSGRAAADQTVSELQAAVDERDAALATTLQRAAAVELLLAQAQAKADEARAWHDEERAAAERERAEVQDRIDRLGDELDAARAAAAAMHAAHQGEQAEAQRQRHVLLAGREAQAQVANDRELQLELARADEARLKAELQGARDGADVLLAQVQAAQSAAESGRAAADLAVTEFQAAIVERDAALVTTLQRAAAVELLLAQAQADADQARAWHDEERAAAERERAEVQNRIDRLGDELDAARAAAAAMHAAHQGEQAEAQRQRHVLTAEREAVAELAALRDKQLKTSGEQIQHLRERMLAAAQEQAHLSRQLDDARSSAQRAHEEQALAAGQMRLMQQALQQHAETARRAGSPPTVQVAAVVAGESRNTPPFRELPFTLTEVSIDEHAIPRLELRLVEHHGNPGLVLLDGPSPGAGLGHWQESGREEGRAYMLLVPADAPARHTLAGLGTHDWRLLEGVVAAIEQALDADEIADAVRWRSTARRLRAQLQETPNRLRYDDLGVSQDPRREGGLLITFRRALFAGRLHPSLTLRWRPGPGDGHADAPLLLLGAADAAQEPPLASWPVGEDGTVAAEWPLPLGTDEATPALRSRWHALPALDRELLFALLDALPAAALRLPAALSGAHPAGPLAADAARWLPLAHQTLDTAGPLPRAARKLRSLMRGVTSA